MTTPTLQRQVGVAVLLVYGLRVPVPRDGKPGFRLTVQLDGAVWVQPVGFTFPGPALAGLHEQCEALDLEVWRLPIPSTTPGFVVRRRQPRPKEVPWSSS